MKFKVRNDSQVKESQERHVTFLIKRRWDDNFEFSTLYDVIYVDRQGQQHSFGSTKLGQRSLKGFRDEEPLPAGCRTPTPPGEFDESLSPEFFSVGQDDNYYETLNMLGEEIRVAILQGLRDCAFDLSIFNAFEHEQVMQRSLLRYVSSTTVRQRFHRLTRKDTKKTRFHFDFARASDSGKPPLNFLVEPGSMPPTNVHVLIGRNGVGKTHTLRGLIDAVTARQNEASSPLTLHGEWSFSGLVFVSFSAFDLPTVPTKENSAIRATTVSLPGAAHPGNDPKSLRERLSDMFVESLDVCRKGLLRRERWLDAIEALARDDLFRDIEAPSLIDRSGDDWEGDVGRYFNRLSSGHAIVLLTMTKLVELVDETTMVILDEPESHLHPPLLSAFIRAVGELMIKRNGLALIATHSPVVLQEVPRSCVYHLRRRGINASASRPNMETFGENVDTITREIFDLEVTRSGFYSLIDEAVGAPGATYQSVVKSFGDKLGSEARGIIRSRLHERRQSEESSDAAS